MWIVSNTLQIRVGLFLVAHFIITPLLAQKVRSETENINSRKYSGYSITINDNQKKVTDFWLEELGKNAKLRRKRDFHQIEELKLPEEYHPEAIYYTRINFRDSSSSSIWIALDPETLLAGKSGIENVNRALENYIEKLPVTYEAFLIQNQIKDALRAVDFTNRQQQKLVQDRKNLDLQLEETKAEREQLMKTLETLELEILALEQKIKDNKAAVEQTRIDLEKINKMLKQYRQNLKKLQ